MCCRRLLRRCLLRACFLSPVSFLGPRFARFYASFFGPRFARFGGGEISCLFFVLLQSSWWIRPVCGYTFTSWLWLSLVSSHFCLQSCRIYQPNSTSLLPLHHFSLRHTSMSSLILTSHHQINSPSQPPPAPPNTGSSSASCTGACKTQSA